MTECKRFAAEDLNIQTEMHRTKDTLSDAVNNMQQIVAGMKFELDEREANLTDSSRNYEQLRNVWKDFFQEMLWAQKLHDVIRAKIAQSQNERYKIFQTCAYKGVAVPLLEPAEFFVFPDETVGPLPVARMEQ